VAKCARPSNSATRCFSPKAPGALITQNEALKGNPVDEVHVAPRCGVTAASSAAPQPSMAPTAASSARITSPSVRTAVSRCRAFRSVAANPEQGFRSCLGILRMAKTYGPQCLEAACRRGISIGAASYRSIASILKTGLDKAFLPETNAEADPIQHGKIRGRGYYH
jgi:hypothetical protein